MEKFLDLETIVISGAGTGIGKAISEELSHPEKQLILIGRNLNRLKETASTLQGNVLCFAADIADLQSLKNIRKQFPKSLNITSIIANAGVGGENHYGENDRWNEIIQTNLTGTYQFTQEFLMDLKNSSSAYKNIVIVSSILGKIGVPAYSAYCASKAGLLGLTRSYAAEYAKDGILVNALCPGWVNTKMADEGLELMAKSSGKSISEIRREQMNFVPLQKMSEPKEIAAFISFLISQKQTSFTGQSFDMNNGAWMS